MSDIKITKERIDALLSEADIRTLTLFGKCTVVTAKLKNGFVLTADSACVDPANYDKRTGERICLEHIANELWELEGYRLQWDIFNKANRKGTAPGLDDETLDEMRTICNRALRTWGAEMQSVVAAEELSELQKELCKSMRGENNADAIAEEIADVQIMLEQMMLLHDCRDAVDEWRRRKLERLEQRLPKIADRSQCNHAWVLERTDGSTRYYYCEKCGAFYGLDTILSTTGVPRCPACGGDIKPDVVLYEEPLDEHVLTGAVAAIAAADALIVGGTSLVVYPAAGLTRYFTGDTLAICNLAPTDQDANADLLISCDIAAAFAF